METAGSPALWGGFILFVLSMLALDLGVFHRKTHAVTLKEATAWSVVWISLAFAFNGLVYFWFGPTVALEFTTGYLIEKALSVDNIFVILVLFTYFGVPAAYQHRVLFWGILGALVMRAIFIFAGAALLTRFHWMIYVFGALLVVTGIKMLRAGNEQVEPDKNPLLRLFRKVMPVTSGFRDEKFFVRESGKWLATPLFLCLLSVEFTDLIFAVDSIPAIFAVTRDPFIVFTSNIFAILGLRSLFFLLAGVVDRFVYLKVGLAVVLLFVGTKMVIVEFYKIPVGVSLGIVGLILTTSVVASLLKTRGAPPTPTPTSSGALGDTAS
jgi:tellurite resistance protein TerC